jgi:hypothetical protein
MGHGWKRSSRFRKKKPRDTPVPYSNSKAAISSILWNNQARILNNAWGYDSGDWLGQELELSLGHYTDKKTETEKENIIVKPISPRKGAAGNSGGAAVVAIKPMEKPSLRDKMLDEIPF